MVWRAGSMVRTLPSNSSVITENWTISAQNQVAGTFGQGACYQHGEV